jgi:hypothetical protein
MNATGIYGNTTEAPHHKNENDEEKGNGFHSNLLESKALSHEIGLYDWFTGSRRDFS